MSGKAPYGYNLEPTMLDGIRTKMMVADPETAERVKLMFEMYAEPDISFGDITRYFAEHDMYVEGKELSRCTLSNLLRNPVYAQAGLEVYEFFKAQGANIVNDAADFSGVNGCYLYQGRDVAERKNADLKDQILVIAPHEGLVSSEKWLTVRRKLLSNAAFGGGRKAKNTWLAGKIKCGKCGAGLMSLNNSVNNSYFRCRKRADSKSCEGCGTLRVRDIEQSIYSEMLRKMGEFQTITGDNPTKANPKLTALNVELVQVENDIEKLLDTLTGANPTLLSYANAKVEELDTRRQGLMKTIADMSAEEVSPEHMKRITSHLENWENADFDDRRLVTDGLITQIRATSESVQIEWKI
jgi:hypothetical protein